MLDAGSSPSPVSSPSAFFARFEHAEIASNQGPSFKNLRTTLAGAKQKSCFRDVPCFISEALIASTQF